VDVAGIRIEASFGGVSKPLTCPSEESIHAIAGVPLRRWVEVEAQQAARDVRVPGEPEVAGKQVWVVGGKFGWYPDFEVFDVLDG
jgi:hypothetical protein